jgi:hypothetical protein
MGEINIFNLIKPLNVYLTDKQMDILHVLSDNKGHAENELAEAINSREQYTNKCLSELSSPVFGNLKDSFSINYYHFRDPLSLIHKIQDQRDSISEYIFKKIPGIVKDDLFKQSLNSIAFDLAISLDCILTDKIFMIENDFLALFYRSMQTSY